MRKCFCRRDNEKHETKLESCCFNRKFHVIMLALFLCFWFLVSVQTNHTTDPLFSSDEESNLRFLDPKSEVRWTWKCLEGKCTKKPTTSNISLVSLETCSIFCIHNPIWPQPFRVLKKNRGYEAFNPNNISLNIVACSKIKQKLSEYYVIFKKNFKNSSSTENLKNLNISINVTTSSDDDAKLKLTTDESYELNIKDNNSFEVEITARSYFGARHALESLSQLIWYDPIDDSLKIMYGVSIEDKPEFPYRGLMIDTARHYFSIDLLKKVVDGMSMSKLNVLHLHLTDAVSFPIVLPSVPEMALFGAYSSEMTYPYEAMKDFIKYSEIRGVRIVLEIDAPSHVSAGWHFLKDGKDLVICDENTVFAGHLNPVNNKTLNYLETIYKDLLQLTDSSDLFHIGNDEVNLDCWRKVNNSASMVSVWADYSNRMLDTLKKANKNQDPTNVVMWSSPLTDVLQNFVELNSRNNLVVQFWFGEPRYFLRSNVKVIFSTVGHWYLDCGFGPWSSSMAHGVCDPYTPWQTFYEYRPWKLYESGNLTLGGEVCLWTEQVEEEALQTRIWPRTAAFAERIWSDPKTIGKNLFERLDLHRSRMKSRGLDAEAIWPKWCSLNPGNC